MCTYPGFSIAVAQLRYFTLRFREYPNVRHLAKTGENIQRNHSSSIPKIKQNDERANLKEDPYHKFRIKPNSIMGR
jgi:hypothetical protein